MKKVAAVVIVGCAVVLVAAEEPDGLKLPPGFHASVVAEGLGPIRHLAVRGNGDIYVSTPLNPDPRAGGIIALHQDANHHADQVQHFGSVDGGTGIRFHNDRLYASTPSGIYRFTFRGNELVPSSAPELIVEGMPASHPGFNRVNRPIAFDSRDNLFVALDASANLCTAQPLPPPGQPQPSAAPAGLKPCPDLANRAGVWRFDANKAEQHFPADGEQWATGIRDIDCLDWSPRDGHLYGIMHGRDNTHRMWPDLISADDDDHIADEMHRITKMTDFGWPYTYFDGAKNIRLISPEYGGDGKMSPALGTYSPPALTFHSRRAAPVDLLFYSGNNAFPDTYRGGAFIVLHGTQNKFGYNVVFVPFDRNGKAGVPMVFADGFAAFAPASATGPAKYRPIGVAQGPDGSLYVADSQKGRIWRIAYGAVPASTTGSR